MMGIIQATLQRHWKKKDDQSREINALVRVQKVMMVDRVRRLGEQHVARGNITLENKETLVILMGGSHIVTPLDEVLNMEWVL